MSSSSPSPHPPAPSCLIIPQLEPYHSASAAATFSDFAAAHTLAQLASAPAQVVGGTTAKCDQAATLDASQHEGTRNGADGLAKTNRRASNASGSSSNTTNSGPRRKRRRPPKSYVVLIAEAILNSPVKCLSIREIYAAIAAAYPTHYADPVDLGWQNTVRYNLSRHPAFVKVPHPPKYIGPTTSNRSSFWTISPEFLAQFERGNFVSAESLDPAGYPAHAASAKNLAEGGQAPQGSASESSPRRRQRTTSMCHQPAVPLSTPLSPIVSPHTPVLAPVKSSSALAQSVPLPGPVALHNHHQAHLVPAPLMPVPMPLDHSQPFGSLPTPTLSPAMHAFARSGSSSSLFFPLRSPPAQGNPTHPAGPHAHHHIVSPLLMPSPASSATTSDRNGRSATRELSPDEQPSSPLASNHGGPVHKMSLSFLLSA